MKYVNPVVRGFYPDPSVCQANGKFYMVCSSFQYFPGVPLFESDNLVNWKQIGNVLTRKEQVDLDKIASSGGVFAPTIRYHEGRFYMVTTNETKKCNFYVYTDDIYGEWSDPIVVDQGGIDPSLLFDQGKVFFLSNGIDDYGQSGVTQCEIDIETGAKLTSSKCIWKGSGGRYLESPHMYNIDGQYYLMAAEGGTEYGHMITYARSNNPWGPFESYSCNPVLTNRDKAPGIIQGIGHGELIRNNLGDWFIISLGFRQESLSLPYHHLGREVFLTPVSFKENGWFTAGLDGTTDFEYEIKGNYIQEIHNIYTFENTDFNIDWVRLRHPVEENYCFESGKVMLTGTNVNLDDCDTPTFMGLRQLDFNFELHCNLRLVGDGDNQKISGCMGGISIYMCENEHYDIELQSFDSGEANAILKLNIGNIKHLEKSVRISGDSATLIIRADNEKYDFYVSDGESETYLGRGLAKYLSSEVSGGFTGVIIGLYAVYGQCEFSDFEIKYM